MKCLEVKTSALAIHRTRMILSKIRQFDDDKNIFEGIFEMKAWERRRLDVGSNLSEQREIFTV